jgi:hypothetical protein
MGIEGDNANSARLEKIQGGVELINERLKHANELQNERYAATCKDIDGIRADASHLTGRVGKLEARDNILVGERQGIGLAAKVLPFLGGGAVMAVAAFIGRAIGL